MFNIQSILIINILKYFDRLELNYRSLQHKSVHVNNIHPSIKFYLKVAKLIGQELN
jgi:hypothetical protein